ncbi:MAG: S24/S26 family peptidase [Acutalibacteraceae bacterium]|nr:S24/S26 family peptidase [Acutalibacteraceae bacterium]
MINREIMVEMDEVICSVISEINNGGTVTMVGSGTSMKPFIESEKDKIVLSKIPDNKKIRIGEIYLYRRSNGRYAIHRVYSVKGNTVSMCGDSQITIETIDKNDLLAIVTQVIKPDQTINSLKFSSLLLHRFRMRYRQLKYKYKSIQKIHRIFRKIKRKLTGNKI